MQLFISVVQVSVLTDQVEAQGEKIRDLEFCLEEHREKLNATEEMLQQVFHKHMSVAPREQHFVFERVVCLSSKCIPDDT